MESFHARIFTVIGLRLDRRRFLLKATFSALAGSVGASLGKAAALPAAPLTGSHKIVVEPPHMLYITSYTAVIPLGNSYQILEAQISN